MDSKQEKKVFKISLSTFLLILAIIVIIVMGCYIYIEKTRSNTEVANLESNIENQQVNITNTTENIKTSNKEIFKRVKTKGIDKAELEYYNQNYIVLEGNSIYFSSDLVDKILEGTYTVDSDNNIDYKLLRETQDYAFYTASIFRFENIDGKKNIVIDNEPDGIMYYEKVLTDIN